MDLRLCTKEGAEPLEDRFLLFDQGRGLEGKGLARTIELLREQEFPLTVYALSSMDRLVLLSQDYWDTPWWILVTYSDFMGLNLVCHIPRKILPWKGATYSCDRDSPEQMVEVVLKALKICRGWDTGFAGVPGLSEIVEDDLAGFKCEQTSRRCRELLCSPDSTELVVWSPEGHASPGATVVATGENEWLVYLCEGGYTYGRWGVACRKEGQLQAIPDESWFYDLEECFHHSSAWTAELPEHLEDTRDIADWRERLRRDPPD